MKRLWPWALALAFTLCSFPAFAFPCCSSFFPQQVSVNYKINVSNLQSNLGLGSDNPTRSIQNALGALQWGAGSRYKWVYGGTTTSTGCIGDGTTVIVSSSGCNPSLGCSARMPGAVSCFGGGSLITLYAGTSASWKVTATSSAQSEVAGAVLGVALQLSGASSSNASTCLSSNSVTQETLIRSRNQFCNEEIGQIFGTGNGYEPIDADLSYSGKNPTDVWTDAQDTRTYSGVGGFDADRGVVNVGGTDYNRAGLFFAKGPRDGGAQPVKMLDIEYDSSIYTTPANSFRRPSVVFEPTRKIWWLFTHDPAYQDQVLFWTTPDRVNWTSRGTLKNTGSTTGTCFPTSGLSPIHTRMQVTPFYDSTTDKIFVAFVNYNGSTDSTSNIAAYGSTGVAGSVSFTVIDPADPDQSHFGSMCDRPTMVTRYTSDLSWWNTERPFIVSQPPAIVCGKTTCTGRGAGTTCWAVSTGVNSVSPSTRDIVAFATDYYFYTSTGSGSGWYRSGTARDYDGTAGSNMLIAPFHPGGQTDFPPTISVSGVDTYDGKFVVGVRGTDDRLYLNRADSAPWASGSTGNGCGSSQSQTYPPPVNWSGWTLPTVNSNAINIQMAPRIWYRSGSNDWRVFIGVDG